MFLNTHNTQHTLIHMETYTCTCYMHVNHAFKQPAHFKRCGSVLVAYQHAHMHKHILIYIHSYLNSYTHYTHSHL